MLQNKRKFLSDTSGQIGVIGSVVTAIALIIGLTVFMGVWGGANQAAFDDTTRALIILVPTVLAAAVVLGILISSFMSRR